MNKKYYILHYPSLFGMGSDTDVMLISDESIRYIIRNDIVNITLHIFSKITSSDENPHSHGA